MFFTDPSWQAKVRIVGRVPSPQQKFHKWRLVGLPLNEPTFIVSPTGAGRDFDAQALMVGDADALIQLLQQEWPDAPPVVRVLDRGKMTLVRELRIYSVGPWEGYAFKTSSGRLESCSPYQPGIPPDTEGICIWTSRLGMLPTAAQESSLQPG